MHIQSTKREIDYKKFYALVEKLKIQEKFHPKKDFFGSAPNVFVGRLGYPKVDVGILNAENYSQPDNPHEWANNGLNIQDIVRIRAQLINSNFTAQVKSAQQERFFAISQEVSLATRAPDVEINLKKAPSFNFSLDQELTPYGPSVKLQQARLTENPKIPRIVETIVNDELKATDQMNLLYQKGFDEHYLTKVLSMGNFGLQTAKKLVPTRWSITATDDTVAKLLLQQIKTYNRMDYQAFYGGYLGNYYLVLCFPDNFRYELFELDVPTGKVWTDFEDINGRKSYASSTAGGYYACRLAVAEKLRAIKKQGSILVLRFVTQEYYLGLGVWVVREASRNALAQPSRTFTSKEELIEFAKLVASKEHGVDIVFMLKQSKLLEQGKQKKLFDY